MWNTGILNTGQQVPAEGPEARDPIDKVCQGGKEMLSKHLQFQKGAVSISCAKAEKTFPTWEA